MPYKKRKAQQANSLLRFYHYFQLNYSTTIGLYLGTNAFMIHHPTR